MKTPVLQCEGDAEKSWQIGLSTRQRVPSGNLGRRRVSKKLFHQPNFCSSCIIHRAYHHPQTEYFDYLLHSQPEVRRTGTEPLVRTITAVPTATAALGQEETLSVFGGSVANPNKGW